MFSINLLGHPIIAREGEKIHITRRKSRALVFYLAAHQEPLSREHLLEVFWPDLPRVSALQTLRTTLYSIRSVMGDALNSDGPLLALHKQVMIDIVELKEAMEKAGDDPNELEQALSLYTGEFMQGFFLPESMAFEDWLTLEREHYRQLVLHGYARLTELHKARQEYKPAIKSLDRALEIQPLQEDLQRERILLYHVSGDRPGAIQRYHELRRLLDEEMGIPPMAETRALYDDILAEKLTTGQGSLAVRAAATSRPPKKDPEQLPFVGRKQELAELQQALLPGKLVLIEGEAGVGKSRLAYELVRKSGLMGLTGAAHELEKNLPYQPIIDSLRSLISKPQWSQLRTVIEKQLPNIWLIEVVRVLPEITPVKAATAPSDTKADEARLWEGIRQLLAVIARVQPVVLVVDDLQWAGDSTLGLLGYLVRQGGAPGLFFISTARSSVNNPSYKNFLQSLSRQGLLYKRELTRLSPPDVLKLAQWVSPKFAPPLADWLQKKSEGNPYILAELVKYARQKALIQPNGVIDLSGLSSEAIIPQTIYSLLQSRLDALTDPAKRILDTAAAMGRQFNYDVAAMAAGLSDLAAMDALDELLEHGLVRQEQAGNFSIDHSLIIEVAYREVGEIRRQFLHRRIAMAIESLAPGSLEEKSGSLAWHFSEAGELKRAATYASMAGKKALKLAAWQEAIQYFGMALQGGEETSLEKDWADLAEAHAKAGEFAKSTDALREAITLAQKNSKGDVEISTLQLAMARSLLPQGRIDEVVQIAQNVCGRGNPENVVIAELIWGTALSIKGVDLEAAKEHLSHAENLWRQNPGMPASIMGQILFESGSVAAQQGDLKEALDYYSRSLDAASKANDSYGLELCVLAHNNLAYHKHLLGMPEADSDALLGLKIAQENGILGMQTYLYSTLGEIMLAAGEFDQAEEYFDKGLDLAQRFSIAERIAGITANQGLLAHQRGQIELALHFLSTALGQAQSLGTKHLEAQIHLWLAPLLPGKIGRQHLEAAIDIAEDSGRSLLLKEAHGIEKQLGEPY